MNNSKLNETTNEKQKANQTVCIDKIIDPLFIKRAGEKSIASQKRNDVMPNNISNELYLECYCDEQWFSYEMVNLGEDAESIYAIVGAISYETILNNRGIDCERKSIYSDISYLIEFGMDIEKNSFVNNKFVYAFMLLLQ